MKVPEQNIHHTKPANDQVAIALQTNRAHSASMLHMDRTLHKADIDTWKNPLFSQQHRCLPTKPFDHLSEVIGAWDEVE